MLTTESFSSPEMLDDRLRKLEFIASEICTERSERMHSRESSSKEERLADLERRLTALLETEELEMSRIPHHETLAETGLSEEDEKRLAKVAKDLHLSPAETEKLRESLKPARQTHAHAEVAALDDAGLSQEDRRTQRLLGLSTRQIQKAKLQSLRAENARLESRR
jgi:hypothetical protein